MNTPRRQPARRGLSYFDANRDRLITVDDDVLGAKGEIERRWPSLEVYFDTWDEVWCIVAHDSKDGTDYLAINPPTKYLDERIIRRLEKADNWSPIAEDPLTSLDKFNAQHERDQERQFEDKIGDAGERLLHALRKDGVMNHDNIESRRRRRGSGNVVNRA